MHPAADQVKTPTLENIDDPKSGVFRTANESLTKRAYQKSGTGGMTLLVRLVTVRSKRRGKLFDGRTGKSEFKFSIGADFLNRDVTGRV